MEKEKGVNKRSQSVSVTEGVKVLLLDMEGTTTAISFVKDVLFGYVRDHLQDYLTENWEDELCKEDVKALIKQSEEDKLASVTGLVAIVTDSEDKDKVLPSVVANVTWLMDEDRKTTSLKQLQGHMWRHAYKSGKVKAKMFEDVHPAMKKWASVADHKIYIYSSGSIEAQKLLFGYTDEGDLTKFLSGYFDTTTGHKREAESYKKIAAKVDVPADEILFLTDIPQEADAAFKAGMRTAILEREGNAPLSETDRKTYRIMKTFDELFDEDLSDDEPPTKKVPEKSD